MPNDPPDYVPFSGCPKGIGNRELNFVPHGPFLGLEASVRSSDDSRDSLPMSPAVPSVWLSLSSWSGGYRPTF